MLAEPAFGKLDRSAVNAVDSKLRLSNTIVSMPNDLALRDDPYFEGWFRVPNFDVMLWQKP